MGLCVAAGNVDLSSRSNAFSIKSYPVQMERPGQFWRSFKSRDTLLTSSSPPSSPDDDKCERKIKWLILEGTNQMSHRECKRSHTWRSGKALSFGSGGKNFQFCLWWNPKIHKNDFNLDNRLSVCFPKTMRSRAWPRCFLESNEVSSIRILFGKMQSRTWLSHTCL